MYHTGKRLYLKRKMFLSMLLYGSSRRYGSRLFVSICACALKNGANAPTWYHRTSISESGFPKKPPTSARGNKYAWHRAGKPSGQVLTSGKRHPRDAVAEDHGDADGHVLPCAEVVAGPDGAKALRACIEGAGENKGTLRGCGTRDESLRAEVMLDICSVGMRCSGKKICHIRRACR